MTTRALAAVRAALFLFGAGALVSCGKPRHSRRNRPPPLPLPRRLRPLSQPRRRSSRAERRTLTEMPTSVRNPSTRAGQLVRGRLAHGQPPHRPRRRSPVCAGSDDQASHGLRHQDRDAHGLDGGNRPLRVRGRDQEPNTPGSALGKMPEAQPFILKDPNNQAEIQKTFSYLVNMLSKPPVRAFTSPEVAGSIWSENVKIANANNHPGKFTAFCSTRLLRTTTCGARPFASTAWTPAGTGASPGLSLRSATLSREQLTELARRDARKRRGSLPNAPDSLERDPPPGIQPRQERGLDAPRNRCAVRWMPRGTVARSGGVAD